MDRKARPDIAEQPPTHRILLVEDEEKLAQFIARHLVGEGYEAKILPDGTAVLREIETGTFSLIILDLNLPGKPGFDVLAELRSRSITIPVLILSARDDVPDRVRGLRMGADDYLTKPFDSSELIARIDALLRRSGSTAHTKLKASNLVMDLLRQTVKRGEKEIILSRREFALLEFFLRNKNQILTRKRIAEQVWGYTFDTGTNIVDVYVSYLRKAIDEDGGNTLIHTVVRQGYVLRDEEPDS